MSTQLPAPQVRRVLLWLGATDKDFAAAGFRAPTRRERRRWARLARYGERARHI